MFLVGQVGQVGRMSCNPIKNKLFFLKLLPHYLPHKKRSGAVKVNFFLKLVIKFIIKKTKKH
jgi:hypothetical protein